jgi:2-(1,2-epoxy-1,2-dihydrophenyl)acetyl-CoA isomerase
MLLAVCKTRFHRQARHFSADIEMTQKVKTQDFDDIVVVTMDNGDRPNTIDVPLCDSILTSLRQIRARPQCRAVILGAAGGVFSAGGDLEQIADALDEPRAFLEPLINRFHQVILAIRNLPIPVIACVHGAAAGAGFSLAMACDVVVASSAARFVVGYPKIGTSSDGGLSLQIARRLGAGRAFELLLLSDSLDAGRAQELGLVQRVIEPSLLDAEAVSVARKLASLPFAAVAELKGLVSSVVDEGLERHLEREREAFLRCASTNDFQRKVITFVNRSIRPTA